MTDLETRPRRTRSERAWDGVRYGLLAGWLLILVAGVLDGEKASSWWDVQEAVRSGEVESVRVSGELSETSTGHSTVTVHWREGWLGHQAQVVQVQGSAKDVADSRRAGDDPIVHGAPSDVLAQAQPGLDVRRDFDHSNGTRLLGWWVPYQLGTTAMLLFLAGLAPLVGVRSRGGRPAGRGSG